VPATAEHPVAAKGGFVRIHLEAPLLRCALALLLLSTPFTSTPAAATFQKTVDGIVVNMGIVPAAQARALPGESDKHPARVASGAQHLLISLTDAKTGAYISGAEVSVEIRDPRGKTERLALAEATTAGVPDYSSVATFAWAGKYAIKVMVKPKGSKRALATTLTWVRDI
jgi:hypothetical protein